MLNPFPELLILSILAPFILRFGLGLLLLHSSWQHLTRERREGIASQLRVAGGAAGTRFIWLLATVEAIVACMLLVGFYTQIAALIGIAWGFTFLFVFRKRFPMIAGHSVSFYLLVIAVCVSLMLSGAGALAIDLPL